MGIKKRIEQIENSLKLELEKKYVIVFEAVSGETIPDVFDRPLFEWATYNEEALLFVNPFNEAQARGGDIPICSPERYRRWIDQQPKNTITLAEFLSPLTSKEF